MRAILLVSMLTLGCSGPKNCPCGKISVMSPTGSFCVWEYFYIDPRPACKGGPAPCPWPEVKGKCQPPKRIK